MTSISRSAARRLGRATWLHLALLLLSTVPVKAVAEVTDCPLRDAPFSVETPIIDILASPAAKAAVEGATPGLLAHLPAQMFGTKAPTFAAIMSMRTLFSFAGKPSDALAGLDKTLRAIPVTAADRSARCARYDEDRVDVPVTTSRPRIMLFEKINGFRDDPSVSAADAALRKLAARAGWTLVATDKGGAITRSTLSKFDAVIWNNVSGDVLTLKERSALRQYIEGGGGFVGIHGSGGDPVYYWDWYVDTLIGARFKGHPLTPQFQAAKVVVADPSSPIVSDLGPSWVMTEEWYSFSNNPRSSGAHILLTLDESSYSPKAMGKSIAMGDHPIAWTKCIGNGRMFYSAIGHRPEMYQDDHNVRMLERAIAWAANRGSTRCVNGAERQASDQR